MKYLLSLILFTITFCVSAQTFRPDLHNLQTWEIFNRKVETFQDVEKNAVQFSQKIGQGFMILKDYEFSNGTIEFDVKGKNIPQQSFVGIAFHVQDTNRCEIVYFRPFNFMNSDTTRRPRSVQYVSHPDYPWDKLRADHPRKYENKVNPVPNPEDWFHAKITVSAKSIKVYVNYSSKPSLEVESLGNLSAGKIAIWTGTMSGGSFANLEITPAKGSIPYGNNSKAGKYISVGDAKLYYEIYGQGEPIVLLHGGVYGYIDEFAPFIERFSKDHQVICIATRGHGKSEIGTAPFTWQQRADDAYKVIRSIIPRDSVTVLGFSDGGYAGYKLAATHPELVKKLIAIGSGDRPKNRKVEKANYTPDMLLGQAKEYFESRLALMPEPKRWGEALTKLNKLYNDDVLSKETFEKIKCPVLILGGDRDTGHSVEALTAVYRYIPGSKLTIVPGCHHVVFFCNFPAVWESIVPFVY
jgi:pimeloyl-ACP methyl ester carboxylesterase